MKAQLTKRLPTLLALGAIAFAGLSSAQSAPTLKVSDGITTVTVVDNGPGDSNPVAGGILFIDNPGSFPGWTFTVAATITKPLSGSATAPFINLQPRLSSSGPGMLTFQASEDFFGPVNGDINVLASANVAPGGTLTYSTFVSNTNTLFAGTPLAPPFTLTETGAINVVASLNLPASFALTQTVVIDHTIAGTSNTDAALSFIPPTGTIGDFVWKDLNANGIQDGGEPGINGVEVQLIQNNVVVGTATTAGNGGYLFTGLPAGTYGVSINVNQPILAGCVPTTSNAPGSNADNDSNPNPSPVILPTNTSTDTSIDFGFKGTGSIGNFVWKDTNQNGIQDSGEPGIDFVPVSLKNSGGVVIATTVTGPNGFYQFNDLVAGTYVVTVDTASVALTGLIASPINVAGSTAANDTNANPATVTLATSSSSDQTVDFGYYSPTPPIGSIGDFVWNDLNRNGIQDSGERGINCVTVTLKDNKGNVLKTTTTAANGSTNGYYMFNGLGAGTYTVTVNERSAALAGCMRTVTYANGATVANDSNPNPVSAILPTNSTSLKAIDFGYIPRPITYTIGGWGTVPTGGNPGTLLKSNFPVLYPAGLIIGGSCNLKFTSQSAIKVFLLQGGTPSKLTARMTNPVTSKGGGAFASQVLGCKLNVDFSNAGKLPRGLGAMKFKTGIFVGKTVTQVLALANTALGGGALPAGATYSDLSNAMAMVNQNFAGDANNGNLIP